uniref:Uncharacterized protein n=1 Tax=Rhizophora mucronata TaxID=61149 RepID=A0A2P2NNE6_RHIMU
MVCEAPTAARLNW